jgi:hypothetical protein
MKWAAKQENVQPLETCFFLTSTFIELTRTYPSSGGDRVTNEIIKVYWRCDVSVYPRLLLSLASRE